MALTPDEIKAIEQAADALDNWRTSTVERSFGDLGSYLPLRAVVETQVDHARDILLTRMPALGEAVGADLDRLLKQAKLVHDLSEQNPRQARLKEVELVGAARPLISRLRRIAQKAREELTPEEATETEQNTKATIAATLISLCIVCVFLLLVHLVPLTWLKNHPNSYSLQSGTICLVPCIFVGLFKPQWRKWCWGAALVALLVLILSLLGGPANSNVN